MPDAARIVARIRSFGANVVLENDTLRIINRAKLPENVVAYLRSHGQQIADFLDRESDFEERAAVVEYEAGAPRAWAERFAAELIRLRPEGVSDIEWSWFLSRCAQIIDEAPERRIAA